MYILKSPKQKKENELKKKLDAVNSAIDDLIIKGRTDTKHYQSLIRIHKQLFYDFAN